jgi:ribosomal protein S12 methylthiotransferase accessory factor
LTRRPTCDPVPIRGSAAPFDLDPVRMRRELADPRFGPVTGIRRKSRAPFPMAEVRVLGAEYPGFGRASTFRQAEAVGFLESFERAASVPWQGVLTGVCRSELAGRAIEPTGLGTYTPGQRAAPGFWLRPYHEDAPMDWVPGHRLRDGRPLFVPAEIGFYRYTYQAESPQAAPTDRPARAVFNESSSGSALGASYEEAVLHSLLELAERDAFLISWHRAKPLPEIDPASVADPDCRMLLHMLRSRGYDPHLLVATADIPVPVVWALALRVDGTFPAALSAAGAGPEPVAAVRSALWELGQLVVGGQTLDRDTAGELLADPWSVRELDDHIRLNALPELVPRATRVLGGPSMTLADAFPDWPDRLVRSARGDVTGALEYVADLFATAGLDEIVVVDQTSPDHRDIGLAAVKAVVPGITPMCFGQAHQRLAGLPRLARALRSAEVDEAALPLDPHPFP